MSKEETEEGIKGSGPTKKDRRKQDAKEKETQ